MDRIVWAVRNEVGQYFAGKKSSGRWRWGTIRGAKLYQRQGTAKEMVKQARTRILETVPFALVEVDPDTMSTPKPKVVQADGELKRILETTL